MRFAIYLSVLLGIEITYFASSFAILPEMERLRVYYITTAIILLLIFIAKFIFLALTKSVQQSKPEFWVNANLLAFAVKFILMIGLMFLLTLFVKNGAKSLIIWTALLYVLLLIADILFDLKYSKG